MFHTQRKEGQRLHIAVAVRLSGTGRDGKRFDCEAWTLNVSQGGAAIQIPATLEVPDKLHVHCDDYQFRADAEVVVVWERLRPQRAIGVRLDPRVRHPVWQPR